MNQIFGETYASTYDAIYDEKDYTSECDLLVQLFHDFAPPEVHSILDLGCGTGNHAIPLLTKGYSVLGIDQSEEMVEKARAKCNRHGFDSGVFKQGDIRNLEKSSSFDVALMMFAVLGYQTQNTDVLACLKSARRNLKKGGLLIFDFWYGPAVLHQKPSQRIKVIPIEEGKIIRVATPEIDSFNHVCTVSYNLWIVKKNQKLDEVTEIHSMRYFFPLEMELFLSCTDFSLEHFGAFPNFAQNPDETTWNVLAIARAI